AGTRVFHVTGVQTCALPILLQGSSVPLAARLCGVGLPPRDEPRVRPTLSDDRLAVLEFRIGERSPMLGVDLNTLLLPDGARVVGDRKSTRLNSSHVKISYAV